MKNTTKHRLVIGGYTCIFLLLSLFNYLTPFIGDDFYYMFSFADGTRIRTIGDIIASIIAHGHIMNGRWVAHSLVQFFGMLPPFVFDLANALVFTAYIALVYKLSSHAGNNFVLIPAIFCLVWLYHPDFSDSILWQDGALNYLWSAVFGLLFINQYVSSCIYCKVSDGLFKKAAFIVLSFFFGAYSENVSAACIFMAMLALAWKHFYKKEKNDLYLIFAIALAFIGYVTIYLAPAQWTNKYTGSSIVSLLTSFVEAVIMYRSFGILWIAFVVMLIINLKEKTELNTIILSLLFLAGSLAANFIMIFAAYYHPRSATGAFCFLLVADIVLLQAICRHLKYHTAIACILAVTMLSTVPALAEATRDIGKTYLEIHQNEVYIEQCKAEGILDIELPIPTLARTDYSIVYGGGYLAPGIPNRNMAKYYGVNSIVGLEIPERMLDPSAYKN